MEEKELEIELDPIVDQDPSMRRKLMAKIASLAEKIETLVSQSNEVTANSTFMEGTLRKK